MWLRLDDTMDEHEKIEALSDAAYRAHMRGLHYCARQLSDGFVPAKRTPAEIEELTMAPRQGSPLWEPCAGGWMIHDYLAYNPSRAKVLAEREAAARRKEAYKERRLERVPNGGGNDSPSRPVPPPDIQEGTGAGEPQAARARSISETLADAGFIGEPT